jgi:CubicO group peptidase (beta-lactamase class C family)
VAKPIVTAAALRLVETGRMGLGDSVRRWLTSSRSWRTAAFRTSRFISF